MRHQHTQRQLSREESYTKKPVLSLILASAEFENVFLEEQITMDLIPHHLYWRQVRNESLNCMFE